MAATRTGIRFQASGDTVNQSTPEIEQYRPYLGVLARMQLARSLQARMDASDVVQQTMLQAHQAIESFRGADENELAAWLRQILARNLMHALRDHQRDKRDLRREQSLEDEVHRSSARILDLLHDPQTDVSQRAERGEDLIRLANALDGIPEAQREAIERHYLQEAPVSEVAAAMERSVSAVGGLLHRGLKSLRQLLSDQDRDGES